MPRLDRTLAIAAVSGVLLAAAFPRPALWPLGWIGLLPLLLVMRKRPFASGLTAGIGFFASALYWLNIVMTTYGGLDPVLAGLAYLLLVIYLAGYFAVATWLACRCEQRLRIPVLLSFPVLWVALEYLRGLLLSGFPWALLGYSQQNLPIAIQSADVTGVYGVSLLLVAVNAALAWLIREPRRRSAQLGAACVLLMTLTHLGYGAWQLSRPLEVRSATLDVALIQGNIDQGRKWDPAYRQTNLGHYLHLSRQAQRNSSPDLLIWPEAATPFYLQDPSAEATQVKQLPMELGTTLLLGSPAYQTDENGRRHYTNSAFLLDGVDNAQRSDKIHLVPFGEYVPLGNWLGFIDKLVVGVGDFLPGTVRPLALDGRRLGVLICYEAIFPELARDYVRNGVGLLVNLTNDAWFGNSSAPYQHLAMSRFRAIENRIWLARAANTGISALVSPSGRVTEAVPLQTRAAVTGRVGLGAQQTFYTRYGALLAQLCLLGGALLAVALGVVSLRKA